MPPIRGRRATAGKNTANGHRANSLGLGNQEVVAFLNELDGRGSGKATPKRTHTRMPFRVASLTLELQHPGGSHTTVQVVCRNISSQGVGVLHGAFAHVGTRCTVVLPTVQGGTERVGGTIVRCSHVAGQIHELGICFNEPVNVSRHVDAARTEWVSTFERVDPETLKGTAVALVGSEIDGRMLGHFLTDSNLKLRITSDPGEGAAQIADGCDVVIIDLMVPCAEEMALAARQSASGLPLIALADEPSKELRALAESMGASGFVVKPLASERVLSALAECLLCAGTSLPASAGAGDLSPELIAACIDQLHKIIGELRDAAEGEDAMQCYALCQQIKATASPIGLDEIGEASDRASSTISESMSIADSQKVIQDLLRLCNRVKKPAA